MLQGICNVLETTTLEGGKEDIQPFLCFDSSKKLFLNVLFPGQKLFVADYHPLKALEPKRVSGQAFFKVNIIAKVEEKIPNGNCIAVESKLSSVLKAHKKYEFW